MKVTHSLPVGPVWSGHPVGFDLLTHGDQQFVAFYDAERKMTVGMRLLGEDAWTLAHPEGIWLEGRGRLSSELGWDSHNSLIMAIDEAGYVHLCGNMHVDPLIYFRTTRPLDVTSFERIDHMVGAQEDRCTYPVFMQGPNNGLVFRYRDGQSGNGVDFYNVYDVTSKRWSRLLDTPLLDGLDRMNAYARMPEKGPDGLWHMVWMWRDTPDCATNHSISYAQSEDLVRWRAGSGDALSLPITIESGAEVDPVSPGGGLINMTQSLGFDAAHRPIVSYHKHDEKGYTQAYCARLEQGAWVIYQLSCWTYRWDFGGGGSIRAEIQLGGVKVESDGGLSQRYWHVEAGSGVWKLDPDTLGVVGSYPEADQPALDALSAVQSEYPGMVVNTRSARGTGSRPNEDYVLRWETLDRNRDRPREETPPPTPLSLYVLNKR